MYKTSAQPHQRPLSCSNGSTSSTYATSSNAADETVSAVLNRSVSIPAMKISSSDNEHAALRWCQRSIFRKVGREDLLLSVGCGAARDDDCGIPRKISGSYCVNFVVQNQSLCVSFFTTFYA